MQHADIVHACTIGNQVIVSRGSLAIDYHQAEREENLFHGSLNFNTLYLELWSHG